MAEPDEPRCTEEREFRIGNQVPQTARCLRDTTPHAVHQALILDSDDNWINERWRT